LNWIRTGWFNAPELQERNIVGVVVLSPRASNILRYLPDAITVRDVQYRFLLVVFLSKEEHEVWKAQGHDALMDLFTTTDKDLISFGGIPTQVVDDVGSVLRRK